MSIKTKYTSRDLVKEYGELSFGEILRSHRRSEELSQIEFSKKLHMSPANLCDLEKGRKIPSPLRASKIAKRLGMAEAFLIQIALQDALRQEKLDFKVSVAA